MERALPALAVTFDFGQTLCDLDTAFLSRRLAEHGGAAGVPPDRLEAAVTDGWRAYDDAIARGLGGHPWKVFMSTLLRSAGFAGGGSDGAALAATVDWLWTEQPRQNLWRRPIPGMIELCRELRAAGVPVGVVSNSEGRLAELVDEIGWGADFGVIADSGRLGVEKPAPFIFHWAAERLGVSAPEIVHVGDSWGADVEGALAAGMRAIWFRPRSARALPPEVKGAREAIEVREALSAWGLEG